MRYRLVAEDSLHQVDFWTSHEALILDYEEALTRRDSLTGDWYDCSAHMLWVGERTRATGWGPLRIPLGHPQSRRLQVGSEGHADDVVALCERLNPDRVPGG